MTTLIILEGPGKLNSFRKYLSDDYRVEATGGHIMDLDDRKMSIDFENNFEPVYCVKSKKEKTIADLRKAYSQCDDLLIASDKDREGEFIAYSIAKILGVKNPKRIRFGDTTKESIKNAINNDVGTIDDNLVNAQKARRILDRIIGYQVSPLLCKSLGIGNLAAGRVMSVVVKLIVEQEEKINKFFEDESECYFCVTGEFFDGKRNICANLYTTDLSKQIQCEENEEEIDETKKTKKPKKKSTKKTEENEELPKKPKKNSMKKTEENEELLDSTKGTLSKMKSVSNAKNLMKSIVKSTFKVGSVSTKESVRGPSPPFTTATMLQEASRKLGMSAERTTFAAQKLYEGEYVTYIRTDSTHMAETAIKTLADFIKNEYGKEYNNPHNYEVKSANAQEAHEAIRPTDPTVQNITANAEKKISHDEIRLYNLIWKRTVASQMSFAKFDVTTVKILISELDEYFFITNYEVNTFKGFLVVYDMKNIEEDDPDAEIAKESNNKVIPKTNTVLTANHIESTQNYKRPPSRFNDASLIHKLEKKEIGRPATTTNMMKKIQEIEYVVKKDSKGVEKDSLTLSWDNKSNKITELTKKIILGKDSNRFVPTHLGMIVTEFLNGYFPDIMDYGFTANIEKDLDEIANGNVVWTDIISKFYSTFEPLIKSISSSIVPKAIMQKDERILGKDPETNYDVIATTRKHGPVLMLVDQDRKQIKIAPIKSPHTLKKITLENALKVLEYPKAVGIYQKKIVTLKVGDLGYYIDIGDQKKGGLRIGLGKEINENFGINDVIKAIEKHEIDIKEKNKDILWQSHDEKNKYVIREHSEHGKYLMVVSLTQTKTKTKKPPLFVGVSNDIDLEQLTLKTVLELISKHREKKTTKKVTKKEVESESNDQPKKPTKKVTKKEVESESKDQPKKPTKKVTNKKNTNNGEGSLFLQHKK